MSRTPLVPASAIFDTVYRTAKEMKSCANPGGPKQFADKEKVWRRRGGTVYFKSIIYSNKRDPVGYEKQTNAAQRPPSSPALELFASQAHGPRRGVFLCNSSKIFAFLRTQAKSLYVFASKRDGASKRRSCSKHEFIRVRR